MIPGIMSSDPATAWGEYFRNTVADMADRDLVDPSFGTLRPLPSVYDEDTFTMAVEALLSNQRQRQGGAALDTPQTPMGDRYADRRFRSLESFEGNRATVYQDHKGFRTVGVGFNMDAHGAREAWRAAGLPDTDFDATRDGRREMNPSEVRALADVTMERAERVVVQRLQGADLSEPQRLAMVSLAFNGPALLGPRLVSAVREGRHQDVVNEILYNSGTQSDPTRGVAVRRYHEAEMYVRTLPSGEQMLPPRADYLNNRGRPPMPST